MGNRRSCIVRHVDNDVRFDAVLGGIVRKPMVHQLGCTTQMADLLYPSRFLCPRREQGDTLYTDNPKSRGYQCSILNGRGT